MTELELDKYDTQVRQYKNAITCKFDNRRVTVIKEKNGWVFEFRIMNKEREKIGVDTEQVHGCAISYVKLSKEAGEAVMLALAEMMNLKISYGKK